MNRCLILGNLGADPEIKTLDSGKAVGRLSVAVASYQKGGEEKTQWFNVIVWEKLAENCGKFLQKGSKVLVEGRMESRTWETDGVKKTAWELIANNVQFLTKLKDQNQSQGGADAPTRADEIPF